MNDIASTPPDYGAALFLAYSAGAVLLIGLVVAAFVKYVLPLVGGYAVTVPDDEPGTWVTPPSWPDPKQLSIYDRDKERADSRTAWLRDNHPSILERMNGMGAERKP